MYYVYLIRCHDNSIYTGITNNIEKRMYAHIHKLKEAAAYTKSREVVSLELLFEEKDRSSASQLEYKIKKLSKNEKEKLITKELLLEKHKTLEIKDTYFKNILEKK